MNNSYTEKDKKTHAERLDRQLHAWARWVESGKPLNQGAIGHSILASLGEVRGHPPECERESKIESLVMSMAQKAPKKADILRMEYGAGFEEILERYGYNPEYPPCLRKQRQRAKALGVHERSYRYHLLSAKEYLNEQLND